MSRRRPCRARPRSGVRLAGLPGVFFESDFLPGSFGFGPKRGATDALEQIRVAFPRGRQVVFEADIRDFFPSIDHDQLMVEVERRVSDRRVRENRTHGLKGGWGNRTATRFPRP